MDKSTPVWTISKDVGVKSPMFSMKSKNKTVPVSSSHNNSVITSGVLLGVEHLSCVNTQIGEEEDQSHLQTVPEHEDTDGGGGGPDGLPKPRRKFGSITAFFPSNKPVGQSAQTPAVRTVSLPSPESPAVKRNSPPIDRESPLSTLTPPSNRKEGKGLLDNFRPRSKSDATCRTSKRPNFLSHLKVSPRRSVGPSSQPQPHRPMSPLCAPHQGTQLCGIRENQGADVESAKEEKAKEPKSTEQGSSEEFPVARTSPNSQDREQGEFRTRAASAGQQARAHVSQIVARFRQRSNSSADDKEKKRYRIVGQNRNLHLLNQDSSARGRNSSLEPETRKRTSSLSTPHRAVDVAVDPAHSAILFRDARGLPVTDPFLASISLAALEKDESQIFVKFFKFHRSYDLIPTSAKLVVFDTQLLVKKAFFALVYNGVRAAPLWDSVKQRFVGMLTITDFIRILQMNYKSPTLEMEELEEHKLSTWRDVLNDVKDLIFIHPDASLYDAIKMLIHNKIHRLPVIDQRNGNVLYILTHKRILRFLFLYIHDMPQAKYLQQSILDLKIGTYKDVEVAYEETPIIEALHKFVYKRVSALPIVDSEGRLIDIYAKFDVINLAAEKTYSNLDVTLKTANQHRNEWFEGVHKCKQDESLFAVMERIVKAEVHRLVVVDDENKVTGVISLSDILNYLVLRPGGDDPHHDYTAEEIKSEATEATMKTPPSEGCEEIPSSSLSSMLDCGLAEAVSLLKTSAEPPTPPPSPAILLPESSQLLLINPKQISSHLLMKSESTDSAVEATEDLLETIEEKKKECMGNKYHPTSDSVSEKEEEKENLNVNAASDTHDDEYKKMKTKENCDRDCKSDKISDLAATCANGDEVSDRLSFAEITIQ